MPLFVLIGRDGPDGLALRGRHRDAHLANLQPLVDAGRVRFAGPIRSADGKPRGSVVVFEADDLAAAQAIVSFSHLGRCRNDAAFAALSGTSPLQASSGKTVHHFDHRVRVLIDRYAIRRRMIAAGRRGSHPLLHRLLQPATTSDRRRYIELSSAPSRDGAQRPKSGIPWSAQDRLKGVFGVVGGRCRHPP